MSESNTTTLAAAVVGAVVGGMLAIGGTFLSQLFAESRGGRALIARSWNDLMAEINQNSAHQIASTYVSLEDEAFKRFRENALLTTIADESLPNALKGLYSRIHEKNELITMWKGNLPTGKDLFITDANGQNPIEIKVVIADLTRKIRDLITSIQPDLEKEQANAKLGPPKHNLAKTPLQISFRIARDFFLVVAGATVGIAFQGVGIHSIQNWLILIFVILLAASLTDFGLSKIKNGV